MSDILKAVGVVCILVIGVIIGVGMVISDNYTIQKRDWKCTEVDIIKDSAECTTYIRKQ